MMRRSRQLGVLLAAVAACSLFSCSRDVYDEERHEEIVRYLSPVDSVDQNHMWQLTTSRTYTFTANANVGAWCLEVYDQNPIETAEAQMLERYFVSDRQQLTAVIAVPSLQTTLYAALVDTLGTYTVTSFSVNERNVNFSSPIATKKAPRFTSPTPMAFTYCFEDEFPESGDYDYNDAVMRISKERTGRKELTVHVTLSAVGTFREIAGAIRLVGYRHQDIDSIVPKGGVGFNKNVPDFCLDLMPSGNLLQGRNNEAVLNLFNDAHWAMGEDLTVEYSNFKRKKYNVQHSYDDDYDIVFAKSASYVIYFKDEARLNNMSMDMLDVFIVLYYSASKVEVHLEEYKNAQTFYNYTTISFKDLPWALKIPTSQFRYPLEGENMGFKKKGALFGAYMEKGHSFGEWAEDRNSYLDWYLYPLERIVW